MSNEHSALKRINTGTVLPFKYEVYDLNGSTVFSLSTGGTWALYSSLTGALIAEGAIGVNNADTDNAGNTIKTISGTIDLTDTDNTDIGVGPYYLILGTVLTTGQTDKFRVPIEIIDLATQGVN